MMSDPQVKCEDCQRIEILKEDDNAKGSPLEAAKRRLRKRCTRAGHTSLPIYTAAFELWENRR